MTNTSIKVSTGFIKSEKTRLPNFGIPPLQNSLPGTQNWYKYVASHLQWHRYIQNRTYQAFLIWQMIYTYGLLPGARQNSLPAQNGTQQATYSVTQVRTRSMKSWAGGWKWGRAAAGRSCMYMQLNVTKHMTKYFRNWARQKRKTKHENNENSL